jgi:hypothetical protein
MISWSASVLAFANGHLIGYGNCQQFEPAASANATKATPTPVPSDKMPKIAPYNAQSDFIEWSKDQNLLSEWLAPWLKTVGKDWTAKDNFAIRRNAASLKYESRAIYNLLVARKDCFESWCYLWGLHYRTWLTPNVDMVCSVHTIRQKHLENPKLTPDTIQAFQEAFQTFLKTR